MNYYLRFDEMVRWMDHVDSNLRTILHEVNTLEEFETEKTIFQVRNIFIHIFKEYLEFSNKSLRIIIYLKHLFLHHAHLNISSTFFFCIAHTG